MLISFPKYGQLFVNFPFTSRFGNNAACKGMGLTRIQIVRGIKKIALFLAKFLVGVQGGGGQGDFNNGQIGADFSWDRFPNSCDLGTAE